jgi:TRAP-type mannitol/chloroaromatic compound transport system permease small subunit
VTRAWAGELQMNALLALSRVIDTVTDRIGRGLTWFILAAVLISGTNAILRKVFNIGSNAWLEVQWYLFAAVFMLGAGYAFLKNAHVRIDFISGKLSARARNWIDIVGIVVFLVPLCLLLMQLGWPLFVNAWETNEMSQNAGGLIRWPVFLLIPLGMTLLLIQALSELVKRIAFLRGRIPDPLAHAAPEEETIDELEGQE